MRMMVASATVLLAFACAGLAQEKKPGDPFVKGSKPPMVTAKATAGEVATESPIEVMKRIIIPQVDFRQATLQDVVEYLHASIEMDGKKPGVNFVLDLKDATPPAITFNARHISLLEALNICTQVAGMKYRIEGNVVMIVPRKNGSDEAAAPPSDPFADAHPAPPSDPFADAHPVAACQIEVEVQFVAFDLTNVEKLVASGGLNIDSLTKLWTNGGGHLLAAPRVITQAGQEATIKGVTEYIYPTSFTVSMDNRVGETTSNTTTGTNTSAVTTMDTQVVRSPVVEPGAFETREVGGILSVMPQVTPEGNMIIMTMSPQVVEEPIWRDYGSKYLDSNGKEQQARMEQPFFQTYTLSTQIAIANGQRILFGGGMPSRDRKQVVYTFVTAQMVGIHGEKLK